MKRLKLSFLLLLTMLIGGGVSVNAAPVYEENFEGKTNKVPAGWTILYDENQERVGAEDAYYTGPRVMQFTTGGDYSYGLYFRQKGSSGTKYEGYALYAGDELSLSAGIYELTFNASSWNQLNSSNIFVKAEVLDGSDNVVGTTVIEATPNLNGDAASSTSGSGQGSVQFVVPSTGSYKLKFYPAANNTGAQSSWYTVEAIISNIKVEKSPLVMVDYISQTNDGRIPQGWTLNDGGTEFTDDGSTKGSGPRVFAFSDGSKWMYVRHMGGGYAEDTHYAIYGKETGYKLSLTAGYLCRLSYKVAAWKGTPKMKMYVIAPDGTTKEVTKETTCSVNANGSRSADMSAVESVAVEFYAATTGDYTLKFCPDGETLLSEVTMIEDNDPMIAVDGHLSSLTNDMFKQWDGVDGKAKATGLGYPETHFGEELAEGATVYGDGSVSHLKYADLSDYDEMIINGTPNLKIRAFFNRETKDGPGRPDLSLDMDEDGNAVFDLAEIKATYGFVHLNVIKNKYGQTPVINSVKLRKASAPYDYILSGSGVKTASVLAALADENATAIDATGVTKATELATANPNCLIKANAGMVTNAQNVIVGGTCANLVITDGKPFKVPELFSATQVSTTREFKAGLINTVCLPFALTESQVSALGKFYDLSSTQDGDKNVAKFAGNMNTVANRPYLFIPKADGVLSLSEEVNVEEGEPENQTYGDFSLMGVQNTTTINSDGTDWVYGFKTDGTLIHITSATELKGMRAYLKVANASAARQISISFGESTGISSLPLTPSMKENGQWFNLAGQRVAQPTRGLYIINGKKVVR